jgi:hypothetical protein
MNRINFQKPGTTLLGFLALIVSVGCNPGAAVGYVLPAEQIVRFMVENFSPIQSLEIVQTVEIAFADQDPQPVFEEKIWLKAPAFYAAERMPGEKPSTSEEQRSGTLPPPVTPPVEPGLPPEKQVQTPVLFRRFLMANGPDTIMDVLIRLGVDTGSTGLDRTRGRVAYRIGKDNSGNPHVLIEKETFLPLLLCYETAGSGEPTVWTIRFGDYRKCGQGWYPHEIACFSSRGTIEIYRITSLQVNVPVQRPLAEIAAFPPPPATRVLEGRENQLQHGDTGFR